MTPALGGMVRLQVQVSKRERPYSIGGDEDDDEWWVVVCLVVVVFVLVRYGCDEGVPSSKKKKKLNKSLKKKMKKLIEVICNCVFVFRNFQVVMAHEDSNGRVLSEPFWKLPSKKELPEYYEVIYLFFNHGFLHQPLFQIIKRPVDIAKIQQRIEDDKYADMGRLELVSIRLFIKSCFQFPISGFHAFVQQHPEI